MFYQCVKSRDKRFLVHIDEFMEEWNSQPEDRA